MLEPKPSSRLARKFRGATDRAGFAWHALRHGRYQPDKLVPHRSVLLELSRAGAVPCTSADICERLVTEHINREASCSKVESPKPALSSEASSYWPSHFDSGPETLRVLNFCIAKFQPAIVVETGVANALSSRAILNGLEAVDGQRLISFDIDSRAREHVGRYPGPVAWDVEILPANPTITALQAQIQDVRGKVGMWYHDSDHSFDWQRDEYLTALEWLDRPGVLVSDDVDGNGAFAQFIAEHHLAAWIVFDGRKCSGIALIS